MEHVTDYKMLLSSKGKYAALDILTTSYCPRDMKNSYTFTMCVSKITYFLWNQHQLLSIVRADHELRNEALEALQRTSCLKVRKSF